MGLLIHLGLLLRTPQPLSNKYVIWLVVDTTTGDDPNVTPEDFHSWLCPNLLWLGRR